MADTVRRFLRIPYTLHVYRQSIVPKPKATLVFLHGIGNSGITWDEIASELPEDVNIIIVDLLGFGDSPKPTRATYSVATQARALMKTLLLLGIRQKVVLVGHSMGSLVAVEFTKRYPLAVRSLVLCSPPLYKARGSSLVQRDDMLRLMYKLAMREPSNILRMSRLAHRAKLKSADFDITKVNPDTYIAALKASIINQTTIDDLAGIRQPVRILYGTLDPFVIGTNIRSLKKTAPQVMVTRFIGGHELVGGYVQRAAKAIRQQLGEIIA